LEQLRAESRTQIQHAATQFADETQQLKATVVALREQLGMQDSNHAMELQDVKALANNERTQLQQIVVRLREQLENGNNV
jgi:hypothetical protein